MKHPVRDGVQQRAVELFAAEGIFARGGTARLHHHAVHAGVDRGDGIHLADVSAAILQKNAYGLLPGLGKVIRFGKGYAHPVRVPKIGDEFVRRRHVPRGKGRPHGRGDGGLRIPDDQQTGHHPKPGDHLYRVSSQSGAAFVGQQKGVLLPAEGGRIGHALPVFCPHHRGDAVVGP